MKEHIENLMVLSENKMDLFPLLSYWTCITVICIYMLLSKAGCTAFKLLFFKIKYVFAHSYLVYCTVIAFNAPTRLHGVYNQPLLTSDLFLCVLWLQYN